MNCLCPAGRLKVHLLGRYASTSANSIREKGACLYSVLGVKKDASRQEIKSAFYDLSQQHHPDKHGGSKESHDRFQQIVDAYNVLGNAEKRHLYDVKRNPRSMAGKRAWHPGGKFNGRATAWTSRPPVRPPPGGKIYDFDRWYSQHYGNDARSESESRTRRDYASHQRHQRLPRSDAARRSLLCMALLLFSMTVGGAALRDL